ncbi:MAG: hypothetical protein ACHQ1H_09290 [Nitrososphaerales archaeon]
MKQFQDLKNRKVVLSFALVGFFLAAGIISFPILNSNAFSSILNAPERIIVHPNPTSPGYSIKIVGYNFPISQTITISFGGNNVGTTKPAQNGQFSFQYTIPATTADGAYTITATDSFGDNLITTLTVAAGLKLTPVRAIDGGSVTLTGAGFSHSTTVTVSFDGKTIKQVTSASTGSFSLIYQIPQTILAGSHTFSAKDAGHSASATFTTISKITLAHTMGIVGSFFQVKGSGFGANVPVTVTFNGATVSSTTCNSTGAFSPTVTVPNDSPGTYVVKATDSKGDTSSSKFTII